MRIVRHYRTHDLYSIVHDNAKIELFDGKWVDGIVYIRIRDGEIFARSKERFSNQIDEDTPRYNTIYIGSGVLQYSLYTCIRLLSDDSVAVVNLMDARVCQSGRYIDLAEKCKSLNCIYEHAEDMSSPYYLVSKEDW